MVDVETDSDAGGVDLAVRRGRCGTPPSPLSVLTSVPPSLTQPFIGCKSEQALLRVRQFVRSRLFAFDVAWAAAMAPSADGSAVIGCQRGDPLRRQVFLSTAGANGVVLLNMSLRRGTTRRVRVTVCPRVDASTCERDATRMVLPSPSCSGPNPDSNARLGTPASK